jgi:hypothetical protein
MIMLSWITKIKLRTNGIWGHVRYSVLALSPWGPIVTWPCFARLLSYKPPTLLWVGYGVRLVVDNTPPVGGSVWSWEKMQFTSDKTLPRLGWGRVPQLQGLLLAVWALQSRTSETQRHKRVLSTYLAFSRMVGFEVGDGRFRLYSGGYHCTTSTEC